MAFSLAGHWSRAPGSSGTDYNMDVMICVLTPWQHVQSSTAPDQPKPLSNQPPVPYCTYFVPAGPSSLPDEVSVIF